MVWEIGYGKTSEYEVNEVPIHILYGHDDEITCVAIHIELDVAVSGSTVLYQMPVRLFTVFHRMVVASFTR